MTDRPVAADAPADPGERQRWRNAPGPTICADPGTRRVTYLAVDHTPDEARRYAHALMAAAAHAESNRMNDSPPETEMWFNFDGGARLVKVVGDPILTNSSHSPAESRTCPDQKEQR